MVQAFTHQPRVVHNSAYELKHLLEVMCSVSAVSNQNLLVLGDPGFGKSEILYYLGCQMFGTEHSKIYKCTPTTPESAFLGYPNSRYKIDPVGAEMDGEPDWIVRGTPLDPNISLAVVDEFPRLGPVASDSLVHGMHDVGLIHRPVFWGTANWIDLTPRLQALYDRFAITVMYQPSIVDVRAVAEMDRISSWSFDVPDLETIIGVRNAPIGGGRNTVIALLEELNGLLVNTSFKLNNRRVRQWHDMLYRAGVLYSGSTEFTSLPEFAYQVLASSYPVQSIEESLKWRSICSKVVDVAATAIAEFQSTVYANFKRIAEKYKGKIKGNPDALAEITKEVGVVMAGYEKEIRTRWPNDERAEAARQQMSAWYINIRRGQEF